VGDFSPGMQPWEHFAAEYAEVYLGKPFWPQGGMAAVADDEVVRAAIWQSSRITLIVRDRSPRRRRSISCLSVSRQRPFVTA
jgi:hypothetical protein